MTQPNPFSTANSLEHLVNPKVITVSGNYEVAVDIANVDTYYGRQLGGPTASQEIQQAYIRQIGTTGISGQAFFNQIGTTGSSGQAFFNTIGSSTSRGDGYFDTVYWNNLVYASLPGGKSKANINLLERIKSETANDRSTDSASKSYAKKDYIKRKKQSEYYRNITEKMFEFYFNKENKISNADKAIMISQMNGSTESANRKSAILTYEYISPNGENVGALRYEHMIPANKVLASLT